MFEQLIKDELVQSFGATGAILLIGAFIFLFVRTRTNDRKVTDVEKETAIQEKRLSKHSESIVVIETKLDNVIEQNKGIFKGISDINQTLITRGK